MLGDSSRKVNIHGEPAQWGKDDKHFPGKIQTYGITAEFKFTSKSIIILKWEMFSHCEKKEN